MYSGNHLFQQYDTVVGNKVTSKYNLWDLVCFNSQTQLIETRKWFSG